MEKLKSLVNTKNLKAYLPIVKSILTQIGTAAVSFLFSGISFAGGISPFATGLTGGISDRYLVASSLGAAAGYVTFYGLFDSLRFVGAVVIICILRLFIEPKTRHEHRTVLTLSVTLTGTFTVSLCVFLAVSTEAAYLIMCLCEAMIATAFSLFILRLQDAAARKIRGTLLSSADTVSAVFTGCVMLLALENLSFYGFSPARCTAFFIIMLFSLSARETACIISGISCALTLGFSDTQPQLMPAFILSGLTAGICRPYGKIPVAVSTVLSGALSLILKGEPDTALTAITETVLSAMLFVFIPEKYEKSAVDLLLPDTKSDVAARKGQALHFMLRRCGKAVKDISGTVSAVSSFLEKADKPDYREIPALVKDDVCRGCNKSDFCWNKCPDLTGKAFSAAADFVIKHERLMSEDLPERLTMVCRMPDKIAGSFTKAYLEMGAKIIARHEISEAKRAAAKQFFCIGSLLDDAAQNILKLPEADSSCEAALAPVFKEEGFGITGICRRRESSGADVLEAYCTHVPPAYDKELLLEKIYEATGTLYLPPIADEYSDGGTVLSFTSEGKISISHFTASHVGAGEEFSGDTARCFFDGRGSFYCVLSDGMGTGTRAAIDSVMTCNLMSRLLRAGFSPDTSLEAVNCALLIKSAQETLSTLDILKVDLETGLCRFYKAGANLSVIVKKERTLVLEKSSMPLGILEEVAFEKSEITLGGGDMVFIMSDGASAIPRDALATLIKQNRHLDPKELATKITDEALSLSISGRHDDITVTCIKFS